MVCLVARGTAAAPPGLTLDDGPEEPPVGWSIAAGLTVALVPLIIGGALSAPEHNTGQPDVSLDARLNAGLYIMQAGLALAPIVSHLIAHEWKRAAIFGAAPTVALIALAVINSAYPDATAIRVQGNVPTRAAIGSMLLLSFLSSGFGLIDSLLAGERARAPGRLSVIPTLGPGSVGLSIGSTL